MPTLQQIKPLKKTRKIKIPKKVFQLKVGDHVRISFVREPFKRFYDENWSREVYTVYSREFKRGVPQYILKDYSGDEVAGVFYENELQKIIEKDDRDYIVEKVLKTKGKGRNKQHLVKWMGWSKKFNSWIPADHLKRT